MSNRVSAEEGVSGEWRPFRPVVTRIGTAAIGLLVVTALLSGCDALLVRSPLEGEGVARIVVALPGDIEPWQLTYLVSGDSEEFSGAMAIGVDGTEGTANLALPTGTYEARVEFFKEWTEDAGNAITAFSPPQSFTVEENQETLVEIADPISTGTSRITVRADVSTMEAEGVSPDIVGVWLSGVDTDNHYHFHADEVDGSNRVGVFQYVQPGTYTVHTMAGNFDHPGWTREEPWHANVTAEQFGETTVESANHTYEPELTHTLSQDFSDTVPQFVAIPGDGAAEITDGELRLSGSSSGEVPMYASVDALVSEYLIVDFDIKLDPYDSSLNGEDAHAHINLLTGEHGRTRVLLVLHSDSVYLASIVEGVTRAATSVEYEGLDDGQYHPVRIAVKAGAVMVWIDESISPVVTHAYHPGIPAQGGFSFESHQPYRVDSLRLTRDIADTLPDPLVTLATSYTLYYRAEAADAEDEARLYRVGPRDTAPVALTSSDTGLFDVNDHTGELLASIDDGTETDYGEERRQAYAAAAHDPSSWTQITDQEGSVLQPRWMNGGQRIVYSEQLAPGVQNIRWAARDGSDNQLLADTSTRNDYPAPYGSRLYYQSDPNWSPDGRLLVLDTAEAAPEPDELEGDDNRADKYLDVNPDGTRLLVTTSENSTAGYGDPNNIYLVDTETGVRRPLFDRGGNESYKAARYSSDGRYIVYSYTEDYTGVASGDSSYDVYRAALDGSQIVRLTDTPDVNESVPYLVVSHE
ncbi:MAG: TolB family protein [Spirochaetota bacterium]